MRIVIETTPIFLVDIVAASMTSIAKLQIYYALQFFLSINKAIYSKQEFIFHRIYLSGSTEFLTSNPINSHVLISFLDHWAIVKPRACWT